MAIKAIINNIEKEIEQIKNSDEQDIDYVYSRIGDIEAEGNPPISMKSIGGNLADYRIYGQTVDGESVGDRTGNLFNYETMSGIRGKRLDSNGNEITDPQWAISDFIPCTGNAFTISKIGGGIPAICLYDENQNFITGKSYNTGNATIKRSIIITAEETAKFVRFSYFVSESNPDAYDDLTAKMLNIGAEVLPYEPYGYKVPVTVSNGIDTLTTPIYLPEQLRKVGNEAEYIDYGEQKLHRVDADDIDVTLPALSTVKGTNTLSVNTTIQPSNIYIKDNFDYKKVFTATRAIEDETPLNYRNIEDSNSTLSNYRIYGNTVDGESVGDRTANLFDGELTNGYHLDATTGLPVDFNRRFATLQPITINQGEYCLTYNSTTDLRFMYSVFNDDTLIRRVALINNRYLQSGDAIDTTGGNKIYFAFYNNDYSYASTEMISNIMLNSGSTPLPYEPYSYRVPVTVSNGTDTLTTNIYLPEQIRKFGDYSDYVDYGSQKFVHRVVRKVFDGTEQLKASERTNVIEYFVPVITMGGAGNSINCTSNHISVVSGNENWANRRVPNAQYVSSFFQNNASQIRFIWNDNNGVVNLAGLTSQLLTWYANGDPLIVDYIIVEPVEEQVTLPALPTLAGTNTLSVGTGVQPSKVMVKGRIKEVN